MTEREQTEHVLVCVECAVEAPPRAVGWHDVLAVGDEARVVKRYVAGLPDDRTVD